jgi:hypothetical protein
LFQAVKAAKGWQKQDERMGNPTIEYRTPEVVRTRRNRWVLILAILFVGPLILFALGYLLIAANIFQP